MEAACAPTAPTATLPHCARRERSTAAPTPAIATHPSACSPKWDSPRAAASTPGLAAKAAWTALSVLNSPVATVGNGDPTAVTGLPPQGRAPSTRLLIVVLFVEAT